MLLTYNESIIEDDFLIFTYIWTDIRFGFFFVQNVNSSDIKTEAILLTIYQDKA
jgi:hypothetical protein